MQTLTELFKEDFIFSPGLHDLLPLLVPPLFLNHKNSTNLLSVPLSFIHLSCSLTCKTTLCPHLPCLPLPSSLCLSFHSSIPVVQAVSLYLRQPNTLTAMSQHAQRQFFLLVSQAVCTYVDTCGGLSSTFFYHFDISLVAVTFHHLLSTHVH